MHATHFRRYHDQELHRYLAMLLSLDLIDKHRYGHTEYYANIKNVDLVDWTFQQQERRKAILRWTMDFRAFFHKTDQKRMTALKSWPKPG
jgi:hypothetical protein